MKYNVIVGEKTDGARWRVQERCDSCGKFVPAYSLIVDGDEESLCICHQYERNKHRDRKDSDVPKH